MKGITLKEINEAKQDPYKIVLLGNENITPESIHFSLREITEKFISNKTSDFALISQPQELGTEIKLNFFYKNDLDPKKEGLCFTITKSTLSCLDTSQTVVIFDLTEAFSKKEFKPYLPISWLIGNHKNQRLMHRIIEQINELSKEITDLSNSFNKTVDRCVADSLNTTFEAVKKIIIIEVIYPIVSRIRLCVYLHHRLCDITSYPQRNKHEKIKEVLAIKESVEEELQTLLSRLAQVQDNFIA